MRIILALLALLAVGTPQRVEQMPVIERPAGLVNAGVLPQGQTPGEYFAEVTIGDIRKPNFSTTIRNVTEADKLRILHAYNLDGIDRSTVEFDHLIPASLAGDNSDKNIWPESKITEPLNAHIKDRLEDRVLKLVREGKIPLAEARRKFSKDWTAFYVEVIGPLPTNEAQ